MSHKFLIDFFDYEKPPVSVISNRPNLLDFSKYANFSLQDIFYVLIEGNRPIRIPYYYIRGIFQEYEDYRNYWRYGEDVMLNTTAMSVKESREFVFGKAIRAARWDYSKPYRGFGVIDPRTHVEILYPFLYLIEGWKLADLAGKMITSTSIKLDVTAQVPSVSQEKIHTVTLRNVSSDLSILIQLYSDCTCNWSRYWLRREEARYKGGERSMCRHGVALYFLLQKQGRVPEILPRPTKILNPWFVLKSNTVIGGGRDRKITKTEANAILGMLIAYMGAENAFV